MSIPPFRPDGMLPVGKPCETDREDALFYGHEATLDEIESRFVGSYSGSTTRPLLFNELCRVWDLATSVLKRFSIWVSGEFVVTESNPSTLFVVLDLPGDDLLELPALNSWLLERFFNDHTYLLDDYEEEITLVTARARSFPSEHVMYDVGYGEKVVNRLLAGRPFRDTEAGYLEVFYPQEGGVDIDEIEKFIATGNPDSPEAER